MTWLENVSFTVTRIADGTILFGVHTLELNMTFKRLLLSTPVCVCVNSEFSEPLIDKQIVDFWESSKKQTFKSV